MTAYRAAFSNGQVLCSGSAEAKCRAQGKAPPRYAWIGVSIRRDGSVYQDFGFAISERNEELAVGRFRRIIAPRKPKFVEVVEARAVS